MNKKWVIIDKEGVPLQDDLEHIGLVVFDSFESVCDSLEYLFSDSDFYKFRGLRIEIYNPEKHKVMNRDKYYEKYLKEYNEYQEMKNEN